MTDSNLKLPPFHEPPAEQAFSRSHKPGDTRGRDPFCPGDVPLETTDELMLQFLNIP